MLESVCGAIFETRSDKTCDSKMLDGVVNANIDTRFEVSERHFKECWKVNLAAAYCQHKSYQTNNILHLPGTN